MTFVCPACTAAPHDGRPAGCRDGTWCTCQHRLPRIPKESK